MVSSLFVQPPGVPVQGTRPAPTGLTASPGPQETLLTLVRHGEVETTYHRVFGGRIDMGLSDFGQQQAQTTARYLSNFHLHALYASPMKRVQQTVHPLVSARQYTPVVISDLREVDFGDWTGLNWDQVLERFSVSAFDWLSLLELGSIPNAETVPSFRGRVEQSIQQILGKHPGEHVGVYCHGGVIRMILAVLLGLPLSRMSMFEIDYASVTQVRCRGSRVDIQLLNFAPWRHLS